MRYIPKLLSLLFLWGAVALVILFVEPTLLRDILIPGSYFPFFVLLTLALWHTLTLIVRSVFYSLLMSITLISGIILSMSQLMHWGLALTLLLTLVIESWYIYHRHEKIHTRHEHKDRGTGI